MPFVYHSGRDTRDKCNTTCDRLAKIPPLLPQIPLNTPPVPAHVEKMARCDMVILDEFGGPSRRMNEALTCIRQP